MNVQGDSADKQKEFPIVLKLSKAKTYDGNGIAEAVIESRDSKEKRKIRVAYGDQKQVSLKHGDVLRVVLPIQQTQAQHRFLFPLHQDNDLR